VGRWFGQRRRERRDEESQRDEGEKRIDVPQEALLELGEKG
jgi:hypothetical protein